ncbi:unnamed protein product [Symbiodinium natans]|uniref:Uncharacterized protein n=1 Tax=Symbiodinium natans TaxID=878477 RepID=A0A812UKE7_9DINO|nr:unnamed protein product [Symbiodinium natans]
MCEGCGCNRPAKVTAVVGALLLPLGVALYIGAVVVAWSRDGQQMVVDGKTHFTVTVRGDLDHDDAKFVFYSDVPEDCQQRADSIIIRQTYTRELFSVDSDCSLALRDGYGWKGQNLVALGTFTPGGRTYGDFQVSTSYPTWVIGVGDSTKPFNPAQERTIVGLVMSSFLLGICGSIALFISLCLMCCCYQPAKVDVREALLDQSLQVVQAPVAVSSAHLG